MTKVIQIVKKTIVKRLETGVKVVTNKKGITKVITRGFSANQVGGGLWGTILGTLSNQTDLQNALNGKSNTGHTHTSSDITDFSTAADARIANARGANNGIAPLDGGGKVPAANLPSYVDDVLEYTNLAAFPITGSTGIIYTAIDTGKIYRWSGSAYVEISPSPGSTDAVPEGSTNLYHTTSRARTAAVVNSLAGSQTDQAPSVLSVNTALATKAASSHTHTASQITDFDEAVEDKIGTKIVAGSNITTSYNDTTGETTISATGGGGGSPGGSDGQMQYRINSTTFGGFGLLTTTQMAVDRAIKATSTTDSILRNAFVAFPTASDRNDANFVIGHTFIPAVSMQVSQLGRFYHTGNTQNHQIGIWEKATGTLVASGTILAASSSDANGFKFVSITPVTLTPAKEYIIAAQEFAGGDLWKNAWDSTGYFNGYVNRTGFAYAGSASFVIPTVFATGTTIYNTCTFKFTPNVVAQNIAAYDGTQYFGMVSASDGTGAFVTEDCDKTVSVMNAFAVGRGSVTPGFKYDITGNSRFSGSDPIVTVNSVNSTGRFGANAGTGLDGVFFRGGYTLIESGSGTNQILMNYDNPARDVSIGGIGSGAKLNLFVDSASKRGVVTQLAPTPTNNADETRNSSGVAIRFTRPDGSMKPASLADSAAVNDSVYYSTTAGKLVYKDSGGTVNALY